MIEQNEILEVDLPALLELLEETLTRLTKLRDHIAKIGKADHTPLSPWGTEKGLQEYFAEQELTEFEAMIFPLYTEIQQEAATRGLVPEVIIH